ncbi:hypothetical protein EGT07_03175 [Herbaspirillum sp. HC18]|nr:hypothetical protein EGT07_03175 [Herbaspirillum sp. HC18]
MFMVVACLSKGFCAEMARYWRNDNRIGMNNRLFFLQRNKRPPLRHRFSKTPIMAASPFC